MEIFLFSKGKIVKRNFFIIVQITISQNRIKNPSNASLTDIIIIIIISRIRFVANTERVLRLLSTNQPPPLPRFLIPKSSGRNKQLPLSPRCNL